MGLFFLQGKGVQFSCHNMADLIPIIQAISVISNMWIESGGTVTQSLRNESGLVLDVTGTLEIQSGGLAHVNAKGLRGGYRGSVFGSSGETYYATGTIVSGVPQRDSVRAVMRTMAAGV